jgi:hypothetical protein
LAGVRRKVRLIRRWSGRYSIRFLDDGTIYMRPITARIIYCVCLCSLAACAALPEVQVASSEPMLSAQHVAHQPTGMAVDLAVAMRRHAEAEQTYGAGHAEVTTAAAAEISLRDSLQLANPQTFERELISALSYELANARQDRTALSTRYGEGHPEAMKADAVVMALTAAINVEVRRAKSQI